MWGRTCLTLKALCSSVPWFVYVGLHSNFMCIGGFHAPTGDKEALAFAPYKRLQCGDM